MDYMKSQGIQTSIHYPPVHQFSFHQHLYTKSAGLKVTEDVASREVTLPLFPGMLEKDIRTVVKKIKRFLVS